MAGIDRCLVLSSQAFTALIPLLILISTLAPVDETDLVAQTIIARFGLAGDSATAVQRLFDIPDDASSSVSVFSAVLLVFSGVSFTRRMQTMYRAAWGVEKAGVRGGLFAAAGLFRFAGGGAGALWHPEPCPPSAVRLAAGSPALSSDGCGVVDVNPVPAPESSSALASPSGSRGDRGDGYRDLRRGNDDLHAAAGRAVHRRIRPVRHHDRDHRMVARRRLRDCGEHCHRRGVRRVPGALGRSAEGAVPPCGPEHRKPSPTDQAQATGLGSEDFVLLVRAPFMSLQPRSTASSCL